METYSKALNAGQYPLSVLAVGRYFGQEWHDPSATEYARARGAVRTICWWVSVTGLCGALAGVLQELTAR